MLSSKKPDESAIVKCNIDQNNFCKGGPQISILTWAPPRLWAGLSEFTPCTYFCAELFICTSFTRDMKSSSSVFRALL